MVRKGSPRGSRLSSSASLFGKKRGEERGGETREEQRSRGAEEKRRRGEEERGERREERGERTELRSWFQVAAVPPFREGGEDKREAMGYNDREREGERKRK